MSTHMGKLRRLSSNVDLTEGSIARGLIAFALPLFLGQLLQQLYNMTDAWVVGNFASNDAFAAVSLSGNLTFLIVGFFNGIAIGGGVVISRYFGARDDLGIERSIHANFLFGLIASVLSTIIGLILSPILLRWMNTPESVMGDASWAGADSADDASASQNAAVRGCPEGVVRHYLRMGVSGWRLDVADELPMDFLASLRRAARHERPDAAVLGEVWEDASNKVA